MTEESLADYIKRLEQENEKLREWLDRAESGERNEIDISNGYRKALEEIRKLTVIGINASQCNCGLRALADDILDKINEVLNVKH